MQRIPFIKQFSWIVLASFLFIESVQAEVYLNKFFTDNMVLQRDKPIHIYGRGTHGENIEVSFGGSQETTTISGGKWEVYLNALPANKEPQDLIIKGTNTITKTNILVGDVWVLGGQSNMARTFRVYPELNPDTIENPNIRFIVMEPDLPEPDGPSDSVFFSSNATSWQPASYSGSDDIAYLMERFSPAGLYYALHLQPYLDIPIGLIGAYKGGSKAECWVPKSTIENHSELIHYTDPNHFDPAKNDEAPSWLYNAVIHPISRFTIKGFLWYQGESNSQVPWEHCFLFPRLIESWRDAFNQGDLPFIFAQIASHEIRSWDLTEGLAKPYLRWSQCFGLTQPNTGMITLIDAGEMVDIHPASKPLVGYRFFMKAREVAYGENIVGSGPMFDTLLIDGNNAIIHFRDIGSGLETRSVSMPNQNYSGDEVNNIDFFVMKADTLAGFEICGHDEVYYNAYAEIDNDRVIVSSPDVPNPVNVRYAWRSFSLANLYNKEGFPAVPFKTDRFDWPIFYRKHDDPHDHKDPLLNLRKTDDITLNKAEVFSEQHLFFYPTIADNIIHIENNNDYEKQKTRVRIFNGKGVMIKDELLVSNSINVSSLHSGIYIIQLNNGAEIINQRFIKN